MATRGIELGDALACREVGTGQTGIFHVESDRVWVEFVGFGAESQVSVDVPIYLHSAKGWVVSLHDNLEFSPMLPSWRRGEVGTIYHQRILTNLAIVGEDAWKPDDLVGEVSFRLTPDFDFLWPRDKVAALSEQPVDSIPNREVLRIHLPDGSLALLFALQSDDHRDKWRPTEPWFSLRFDAGVSPSECLERVWYFESLFALLSWGDVRATTLSIKRVAADEGTNPHHILTSETADAPVRDDVRMKSLNPLSSNDEIERDAMKAVLAAWLNQRTRWIAIAGLMRAAQRRFRQVSGERALDACRWHELLESTEAKPVQLPGMKEVTDAAVAKAQEHGLGEHEGRIRAALKGIRGETRRMRFGLLRDIVNKRLPKKLFDDVSIGMMEKAYHHRQVTGHGAIGPMPKEGVRHLWGDILAMEAMCACRMLVELPFSASGLRMLDMHPLLRAFVELRNERRSSE